MRSILKCAAGFVVLMSMIQFHSLSYSNDLLFKVTTGSKIEYSVTWNIMTNDQLIIYSTNTLKVINIVTCGQDYKTVSWNYKENNADVTGTRDGNLIIISGQYKNNLVCMTNKIDDSPWYESIESSLSIFALGKLASIEFWLVRSGKFQAYKMVAYRKNIEAIKVNGNSVEAQKVTVTLPGILSIFWKVDYWFRVSDGQYVRFEGKREGGDTVVELNDLK